MKLKSIFILLIIIIILSGSSDASDDLFNSVENDYLQENQDKTLTIGIYPMTGNDYFSYDGKIYGYILEVIAVLEDETNIDFDLIIFSSWDRVYKSFLEGKVDLIFGANKTAERQKKMLFTAPLEKIPYAIFIHKDSNLMTIGDFENKIIGFQKSDMIIDTFQKEYNNLTYRQEILPSQLNAFHHLTIGTIDGVITSGGLMAYEFLYDYENIKLMTQLEGVTSNMTLATLKENKTLMTIIRKVLAQPKNKNRIEKAKSETALIFNRKVLQLTAIEKAYLKSDQTIRVGVLKNYLPLEFYKDGEIIGVSGEIFNYISQLINLETEIIVDDFHNLYSKALAGDIDLLMLAKTDAREKHFDFPRPFYEERDIIYGNEQSESIDSIYCLESKKVAVIKNYWHIDYLKKNLRNPNITITNSIQESLKLLAKGEVEYLIENRLVGDYYINHYGYENIQKKGVTTRSSSLYYGVTKNNGPLASIIDKSLKLIDYKALEQDGIDSIPHTDPIQVKEQRGLIVTLVVALIGLSYVLFNVFKNMIQQRLEAQVLKEKQKMMYRDSLTGLNNRTYFDKQTEELKAKEKFCFVMIDLDDLKAINDTYGHLVGDELIKIAALKIKKTFKDFEHIRFGGDEFLLISENKSEEELKTLLQKSQEIARETTIVFENITLTGFSFGIGYAIRKNLDETINDVFIRADASMYENKRQCKLEE